MLGTLLQDRYQVVELIGEGGMSFVYRAKDIRTGHDVAVKFLRPEYKQNPEFIARFQREATTASRMSHHNIVNLLDVGSDTKNPYIVIEYVDGKTLKDIIRERKTLPEDIAAQIAIRILSALQHAHAAGVIHRDIKPQNILVDQKGYIKVSDFGIARMVGAHTATIADGNNSIMGSVHYFSPEQARGETATAASDLYSVGVVLYEMLTGSVPFNGESSVAIALQHVQAKPKPVRELSPKVSTAIESVVHKALEKSPQDRFHTALEMAQALKIALQSPEKDTTRDTPVLPTIPPGRKMPADKRRRLYARTGVAALALALLVVLALGAFYIYQQVVNTTRAPFMIGEREEGAIRLAEKAGLKPQVVRQVSDKPAGTVVVQSHDFNYPMRRGDLILITVSTGPAQQTVPLLEGLDEKEAKKMLDQIGLIMVVAEHYIDQAEPGTVIAQDVEPGLRLDYGSVVQVEVSLGEVLVPKLTGLAVDTAKKQIQFRRLTLGKVENRVVSDPAEWDKVAAQLPHEGETVEVSAQIDLVVNVPPATTAPNATPTP